MAGIKNINIGMQGKEFAPDINENFKYLDDKKADKSDIINNKGIFDTATSLKSSYPASSNKKGFFAFVSFEKTFRKWEVQMNGGEWMDTEEDIDIADIPLSEYAKIQNDNGIVLRTNTICNISQIVNDYGFITKLGGRRASPEALRALGQIISYRLNIGEWIIEQYIGTDIENWENDSNWRTIRKSRDWNTSPNGNIEFKSDIYYYKSGSQTHLGISLTQGTVLKYEFELSNSGFAIQFQAVNSNGDVFTLKSIPDSENTGTFSGELYIDRDIQDLIFYAGQASGLGKGTVTLTLKQKNAIVENIGQRMSAVNNLFTIDGFIHKQTGVLTASTAGSKSTDFIKVEEGESVYICGVGSVGDSSCYALFDENKQFIRAVSGLVFNNIEQLYAAEKGISYIRVTKSKEGIGYILCKSTNQYGILDNSLLELYQKLYKSNNRFIIANNFVDRSNGLNSGNINCVCTDLEIWDKEDIIVYGASGVNSALLVFYDEKQRFISSIYGTEYKQKLLRIRKEQIPSNTVYIRSSGYKDDTNILANGSLFSYQSDLSKSRYQFGYQANFNVVDLPEQETATHRSLSTYYQMCDDLVTKYPEYVSKIDCDAEFLADNPTITRPSELSDAPIYMYVLRPKYANVEVGHNGKQNFSELKFYINAGTHGFEWVGIQTTINFMKLLCEHWNDNVNIEDLRFNVTFYITPCSSSWGVVNDSRVNYNGVDPNRNTSAYDWELSGLGTNIYSGSSPASEYETKVFEYYFNKIQPQLFVDIHNFGTDLVGNNYYSSTRSPLGRDISAIFLSAISRQWKKYNPTTYPQDTTTLLGWQSFTTPSKASKAVYACTKNALGWTYETCGAHVWKDGKKQPTAQATPSTEGFMTESLQGFTLFILYACKGFTNNQ